jgi:hypothetical protein
LRKVLPAPPTVPAVPAVPPCSSRSLFIYT